MLGVYSLQLDCLLRLIIAGICGIAIGYERRNRMKEAGIRTHFIVAVGAALIMIVSKYGFQDQIGWRNLTLDPSRIAAQVVTGVGFLGAGIIFMQEETIKGLTTAAGIWTTAGIGLALGSGLYFIGLVATITVIIGQFLLHGKIQWLSSPRTVPILIQIEKAPEALQCIQKIFKEQNATIIKFKSISSKEPDAVINLEIIVKVPELYDNSKLLCLLQNNPFVRSVEL